MKGSQRQNTFKSLHQIHVCDDRCNSELKGVEVVKAGEFKYLGSTNQCNGQCQER